MCACVTSIETNLVPRLSETQIRPSDSRTGKNPHTYSIFVRQNTHEQIKEQQQRRGMEEHRTKLICTEHQLADRAESRGKQENENFLKKQILRNT